MTGDARPRSRLGWLLAAVAALALCALLLTVVRRPLTAPPAPTAHPTAVALQPILATSAPAPAPTATTQPTAKPLDLPMLARTFDAEAALAEIEQLCRPEFGGRQAGAAGGRAAAEYIAGRFAALGLQPAGDGGSYLQELTVPLVELSTVPRLTLTNGDGRAFEGRFPEDVSPIINGAAGPGAAEGPLVWAGHGAAADLVGVDLAGAMIVCRLPVDPSIYHLARDRGAAGLLIVCEDAAPMLMGRVARETTAAPRAYPAAYVGPDATAFILAGSGHTLSELERREGAVPLAGRGRLEVAARQAAQAGAQNVLGVLLGGDAAHRSEVIVLGAHYDHLGRWPDGTFFAGANDNASGVAALLEIARTWQAASYIPARTVLFAAWDGEEQGMLGSQYYVRHATLPLNRVEAMLQLDMVGVSPRPVLYIDGDGLVADHALAAAAELGVAAEPSDIGRSDHASFRHAGIPATMFISAAVDTGDYHRASDTPETIDLEYLGQSGVLAELVALRLSMAEPVPVWQPLPAAAPSP